METEATKEELQRIDFMRIKKSGGPDGQNKLPDDRRQKGEDNSSEGSSNSSDMNLTSMSDESGDESSDEDEDSDKQSDSEEEKDQIPGKNKKSALKAVKSTKSILKPSDHMTGKDVNQTKKMN